MSEVKTYQQADEPTDVTPGTVWLRSTGTKAQRDLTGTWIEKGTWTETDDGLLPLAGGAVTGPVTGNHGHAPLDSPGFTTNATLDGEDLSTKTWVSEQIADLMTTIQDYIANALGGGESSITIGQNIVFGYGTLTHGETVPLPTYSTGVRAVKSEIVALLPSWNVMTVHDSASAHQHMTYYCSIDPDTLVVSSYTNGDNEGIKYHPINYLIVCVKS